MVPQVTDFRVTPYRHDRAAALSFTYDDGYLEHFTQVAPELEKRGFRGSFWIVGQQVGTTDKHGPRVSWEQVRQLHDRGHEVGNHTWSHPRLTRLPSLDEVRREVTLLDDAFVSHGLPRPVAMAYPYNDFSPAIIGVCEEGRIGSRTRQVGHGEKDNLCTPAKLSQWLRQLIREGEWGITMTHGITQGYDLWYHPEWLWNFYDEVKAHEDSVWVATFAQVAAYQRERQHLQLMANKRDDGSLTVTPRLNGLNPVLFHEPLTLRLDGAFEGCDVKVCQRDKELSCFNAGSHLLIDFDPSGGDIVLAVG